MPFNATVSALPLLRIGGKALILRYFAPRARHLQASTIHNL